MSKEVQAGRSLLAIEAQVLAKQTEAHRRGSHPFRQRTIGLETIKRVFEENVLPDATQTFFSSRTHCM